jgi:Pyridoxamine 5'-phosphate oxidase
MRRWADFEEAAPDLAALGRERIERFGFVFLGTLRKDGGPRVNPVEAHFVEGHLAVATIAGSLKALDLLRDPRASRTRPCSTPASAPPASSSSGRGHRGTRSSPARRRRRHLRAESAWRSPDERSAGTYL